ncbi:hypothetical protein DL93DRAFT_909161 [Clavulina sp. PMI_390]|nr:hypothetical protein DL93DRAFT_909161 [Clavulina sp. PMI_390]
MTSTSSPITIPKESMAHTSNAPISPALAPSSSSDRALSDRDREMTSTIPGPPPIPFKLHTRRGSRSAPDPWALGPLTSTSAHDHSSPANSTNVGGAFSPPAVPSPGPGSGVASSNHSTPTGGLPIPIPSSGASRITIVRVHDREDSIDAGDMSDGTPSSFGVTAAPPRPGRSNSWGSNYSSGSNASGVAVPSSGPNRSHSPARRPGSESENANIVQISFLPSRRLRLVSTSLFFALSLVIASAFLLTVTIIGHPLSLHISALFSR